MNIYSYRRTGIDYGIRENSSVDVFRHRGRGNIMDNVRTERTTFNYITPTNINYDDQEIFIGVIDHRVGRRNGYRFELDTRGGDSMGYLQDQQVKAGIVIEGSTVNELYRDSHLLGIITVDDRGDIIIDSHANRGSYKDYVVTGPILVEGGIPIITDDIIAYNENLLQCRIPNDNEEDMEIFEDGLTNYLKMKHTQPQQANIITSRTALIFTPERIMFVYVTSDDKSPGMDLSQLTQLCLGLNATFAISLGYGGDVRFSWREDSDDYINVPDRKNRSDVDGRFLISYISTNS